MLNQLKTSLAPILIVGIQTLKNGQHDPDTPVMPGGMDKIRWIQNLLFFFSLFLIWRFRLKMFQNILKHANFCVLLEIIKIFVSK